MHSRKLIVDGRIHTLDNNVWIVGFGKAVLGMVAAAEEVLAEHIIGGVVSVPLGIVDTLQKLGKE